MHLSNTAYCFKHETFGKLHCQNIYNKSSFMKKFIYLKRFL